MIKRLIGLFDLNRAIVYSLGSKGFSAIGQPLTIYFILTALSPVEQGFYYTFYGVIAMAIFLELGLGVVITHFSSNEFASLRWTPTGALDGDAVALSRLLSILRKSLGWYGGVVLLTIAALVPIGLRLFRSQPQGAGVDYVWPWILLMVATGLGTWLIPLISMLGGSNRITDVQRLRLIQNVAGTTMFCGALALGARLYAPALMQATQSLIFLGWFVIGCRGLVGQLVTHRAAEGAEVSWRREILPMQWRVGLSWLSSYFISYTTNPLLFAYRGPIEAGQMGVSRQITDQVTNLAQPWVSTRSVTYGIHASKRDYATLDRIALRATLQGVAVAAGACIVALIAIPVWEHWHSGFAARMLPLPVIGVLMVSALGAIAVNSAGEYVRAQKQEPYLYVNLVLAIAVTISNYITARYFNAATLAVSYALVTVLIGWPLAARVFIRRRKASLDGSTPESASPTRNPTLD